MDKFLAMSPEWVASCSGEVFDRIAVRPEIQITRSGAILGKYRGARAFISSTTEDSSEASHSPVMSAAHKSCGESRKKSDAFCRYTCKNVQTKMVVTNLYKALLWS